MAKKSHKLTQAEMRDAFSAWLRTMPGEQVLQYEREILNNIVRGVFGYRLLQIESLGDNTHHLDASPIPSKLLLVSDAGAVGYQIRAEGERLPIATDSIDAVLLPHTLDFAADPKQVLREVERILIPEGRLIITAFNPWSLWGLWRKLLQLTNKAPWFGEFVSYPRLHDWLSLLGFDIDRTEVCMFRPPLKNNALMTRLGFMERWGKRFIPWAAGIYVASAIKRVSTLTPIGPRWRLLRQTGNRVAEPSARGMNTSGYKKNV